MDGEEGISDSDQFESTGPRSFEWHITDELRPPPGGLGCPLCECTLAFPCRAEACMPAFLWAGAAGLGSCIDWQTFWNCRRVVGKRSVWEGLGLARGGMKDRGFALHRLFLALQA
jgi:hypothetical protein